MVPADPRVLAPIDGRTEVWASGVTYLRSRQARVEESTQRSVYELVYDAVLLELLKAPSFDPANNHPDGAVLSTGVVPEVETSPCGKATWCGSRSTGSAA